MVGWLNGFPFITSTLEGYRESRRCSRDTYPDSYITKYTSIRRQTRHIQDSQDQILVLDVRTPPPLETDRGPDVNAGLCGRVQVCLSEHVCCMLLSLYFPVTCNPTRAVTLPNIGVPLYIGVPRRVTYLYGPRPTPAGAGHVAPALS